LDTMSDIKECGDCRKVRVRVKRFVEEMRSKMRRKRGKSIKDGANQESEECKQSKEGNDNESCREDGNSYAALAEGETEALHKDSPLKSLPDVWKCILKGAQAHVCEMPLESLPEIWKCDSSNSSSHKSIR
jgi:hypothetical protein